jgi:hypothetical protein
VDLVEREHRLIAGPDELLGRLLAEPEVRAYLGRYGMPEVLDFAERHCLTYRAGGIEILANATDAIETVFLHSAGHDDMSGYKGPLPLGLRLEYSRWAVRDRIGRPAFVRAADESASVGSKGLMERYDLPAYSIHLEYRGDSEGIVLVCLMLPGVILDRGDAQ